MDTSTPVSVRDLHKRYGRLDVLKGISMEAGAGDVVSIIGASGSGKSTFLRCINLLETYEGGDIHIFGERLAVGPGGRIDNRQADRTRTRAGMVFQNFNLWSHRTVMQNLTEAPIHVPGLSRRAAEDRAAGLLEKVGIAEKRNHYPTICRAVSSSARPSRGRWRWSPMCCCSTSRPRRSTPSLSAR